jgi:hypothetical protein
METYCHTRAMHFSFHLLSTEIKKVHNEKYSFQFFSYTPPPSLSNYLCKLCSMRIIVLILNLCSRYRDPKTGLPYATKEAFKIIRERYGILSLFLHGQ